MIGLRSRRRKKDVLPYDMFDLAKQAYDAKTGAKLEKIYHRGQDRAWSGKEILPALIEEHGKPDLPQDQQEALARIFAIILWGELAAWKISAQLAEALEPLEARMAATSQAHDEARHFYTMYDYLQVLGYVPESIDRLSERVLDNTLRAKSLAQKVCGMQLMIETIALTIFQTVRESGIEPVLGNLLRYFEIDEARHVGLGISYMPFLIRSMNRRERAGLFMFQMRLFIWVYASMREMVPDLETLGINPRTIIELGKAKQVEVFREMWGGLGIDIDEQRPIMARIMEAADEIWFPEEKGLNTTQRLRKAAGAFTADKTVLVEEMAQEAKRQIHDHETLLPGMGAMGRQWAKRRKRSAAKQGRTAAA